MPQMPAPITARPIGNGVDPDGSVHYLEPHDAAVPPHRDKKVCYEKKTCYESQTRRSARRAAGGAGQLSRRGMGKPEGAAPVT